MDELYYADEHGFENGFENSLICAPYKKGFSVQNTGSREVPHMTITNPKTSSDTIETSILISSLQIMTQVWSRCGVHNIYHSNLLILSVPVKLCLKTLYPEVYTFAKPRGDYDYCRDRKSVV